MIISNCRKIVGGSGEGKALVTDQPINFLAMVDAKTGMITDPRHELHGGIVLDQREIAVDACRALRHRPADIGERALVLRLHRGEDVPFAPAVAALERLAVPSL